MFLLEGMLLAALTPLLLNIDPPPYLNKAKKNACQV